MTLKKLAVFSAFLFFLLALNLLNGPVFANQVFAAVPPATGSSLDYGANNLASKAPFWYPCHDWKFSWFVSCTYTPVLRLTLTFSPAIHAPVIFDPIFLSPQSLPLPRNFTFSLPSRLEFSLPGISGSFTPILKSSVSFIPSDGTGGVAGLVGSGAPSGDLTVGLPPITFKPITGTPDEPVSIILPLPGSFSVPVPPPLTIPSPLPGGATSPIPSPGVIPPPMAPGAGGGYIPPSPTGGVVPPSHSAILSFFAPSPTPTSTTAPAPSITPPPTGGLSPTPTTAPISGGVSGVVSGIISGVSNVFRGLSGGLLGGFGGGYDFGDAPDGAIAYPDLSGGDVGGGSAASGSCSSSTDSAPGSSKTTATAICGLTCPAGSVAKVDMYTGAGTPYTALFYPPDGWTCNGKPTLGPSHIECSCR